MIRPVRFGIRALTTVRLLLILARLDPITQVRRSISGRLTFWKRTSARRCGHKLQIMVISCRLEGRILQIKVLHCFINSAQSETYSVLSSALLFPRLCAHWCPAAVGLLSVTLCNCNYFGDKYDTLSSVWKLGVQSMLSVHKAKSYPELQSVWWMTQTPFVLKKEGCWKVLVLSKQQFERCKDQVLHFMMGISKALNLSVFLQVHLFRIKCLKMAELLRRFGLRNSAEAPLTCRAWLCPSSLCPLCPPSSVVLCR